MQSAIRREVGLLGATSLIGEKLISLHLGNCDVIHAYSRSLHAPENNGPIWHQLSAAAFKNNLVEKWFSVAPIWVLPKHFAMLESSGIRRIVVLSSTSRFTKKGSSNDAEKTIANRLIESEESLKSWAINKGVEWVILRPTLIYGYGRDKNITEIIQFINRFGFFPLLGKANGLRQPIHVDDVAEACVAALNSPATVNRTYNISGKDTVPYREMVNRVFAALHRTPRLLPIPLVVFQLALACMRLLPKYHHWSVAMAERMNTDLIFDHSDAIRDFGFSPRPFQLTLEDLPP